MLQLQIIVRIQRLIQFTSHQRGGRQHANEKNKNDNLEKIRKMMIESALLDSFDEGNMNKENEFTDDVITEKESEFVDI